MIVDNGWKTSIEAREQFEFYYLDDLDALKARTDLILVFGGDGTLVSKVTRHGLDPVYLPINAGSLGFLMNNGEDLHAIANQISKEEFSISELTTLKASIKFPHSDVRLNEVAVNDVYMERASGQSARLEISVDGSIVTESMIADGVIVSSPTGSTGYNLSAGGAILLPQTSILQVTPICAHTPKLPPFVVPSNSEVDIWTKQPDKRPVRVVVDGRDYEEAVGVSIRVNEDRLKLAYLPGNDFTERLISKILRKY
jgi:NAD+ kinase